MPKETRKRNEGNKYPELEKAIARFPMFNGLPRIDLHKLAEIAVTREFSKGQTVFIEGHESLGFYLLEKGRVKVFKLSSEGKEHILHIIEPGSSFAEACIFFEEYVCPATASALEDSITIFFRREPFVEELRRNPSISMRMLGSMARWIKLMTEQAGSLSLNTVEGRFAKYLVVLAKKDNVSFADGETLRLDVEKSVLASRLGTIPETLSRTLKKLQQKRLIKVEKNKVTILDAEGLLEMLE